VEGGWDLVEGKLAGSKVLGRERGGRRLVLGWGRLGQGLRSSEVDFGSRMVVVVVVVGVCNLVAMENAGPGIAVRSDEVAEVAEVQRDDVLGAAVVLLVGAVGRFAVVVLLELGSVDPARQNQDLVGLTCKEVARSEWRWAPFLLLFSAADVWLYQDVSI